ncbi:MAG: HNH endonuclease [Deltaproteobacteria bacterium]|nr:HNH endonuclease [Deltaproteobacteria bacterium]
MGWSEGGVARQEYAHRLSYVIAHGVGSIPEGHEIRHVCDVPSCVEVEHLSTGTRLENLGDAVERRRIQHGTGHYLAKLNEDRVREIMLRSTAGESAPSLAVVYGVTRGTITAVTRGRSWNDVTGLPRTRKRGRRG